MNDHHEPSADLGWERRHGMRAPGGWRWGAWRPCTEAEARRVTGLRSWQVQRTGQCAACGGTGRVPCGMQRLGESLEQGADREHREAEQLVPELRSYGGGKLVDHPVNRVVGDLHVTEVASRAPRLKNDVRSSDHLQQDAGSTHVHGRECSDSSCDAEAWAKRNDDLIRLGRSAGK